MNVLKFILFVAATAILSASASAQEELGRRLEEAIKPTFGGRDLPAPEFRKFGYNSGASYWISPMLKNSHSTINGQQWTVNGTPLQEYFAFSAINPSGKNTASAFINCHTEEGAIVSRYSKTFGILPLGAVNWSSEQVTPPVSGSGAVADVDQVWCVVGADDPIVVFGSTERRHGGQTRRHHFSLERAEVEER